MTFNDFYADAATRKPNRADCGTLQHVNFWKTNARSRIAINASDACNIGRWLSEDRIEKHRTHCV